MGTGSNNFAEIIDLKLLLTLALENHISNLQTFGDSQLVINWVIGKFRMHNSFLSQVLWEVIRISDMFERVEYKHIYRERNSNADGLAKAGALEPDGCWIIKEFRGAEMTEVIRSFRDT